MLAADPEVLEAALGRLDPADRALLEVSLRREVADEALAELLQFESEEVARRRAAALDRIAGELDATAEEAVDALVLHWRGEEGAEEAPVLSPEEAPVPASDETRVPALGDTVVPAPEEAPPPAPEKGAREVRAIDEGDREIPAVPTIAFVSGQRAGSEVPVGQQIVVGRDLGAADVVLDQDAEVSRRHATFSPAGTGLTVRDLGSTNGTLVNGERIAGTVALKAGDRVELGSTVIEVRVADPVVIGPPALPAAATVPRLSANTIEADGLVKQFGSYRAVDGISLMVNPAEVYGFLGPNGAGKSTTVHMLTTLLPPTSGAARIAGYDVLKQGSEVRATIGVALQEAALDPHLNCWEHMDLQTALQGIPRAERRQRAEELIERVGLAHAADRRVGDFSGGMKRRLDLALALVHRPRVLFLDEPTTGLDPQSRTALWEEVAGLVKEEGMTVFLTTQYLEEADVLADRVGIIDHGDIVAEGTPAQLKAEIGRPTVEVVPLDGKDFAAVSEVLARFGELESAARKGVAVRLQPGVEDMADVIRALDDAGLRFSNVELHAPTLDDVFLAKTGRSLEGVGEEVDEETPSPGGPPGGGPPGFGPPGGGPPGALPPPIRMLLKTAGGRRLLALLAPLPPRARGPALLGGLLLIVGLIVLVLALLL